MSSLLRLRTTVVEIDLTAGRFRPDSGGGRIGTASTRRRGSQERTSARRLAFMRVHALIIFPGWNYGRTGIE